MLVKLTSNDIVKCWDLIKIALLHGPPLNNEVEGKYHRMLRALMTGEYVCWFLLDENESLKACIITGEMNDYLSGNKNLLIYLLYSYSMLDKRDLATIYVYVKNYAKAFGYSQVVGFTKDSSIEALLKRFNGNLDYKFFTFIV